MAQDLKDAFLELYREVGASLSAWQLVEMELAVIFIELSDNENTDVSSIIYHRLGRTQSKALALNELAQYRIKHEGLLARWSDIWKVLEKSIRHRNDIVHTIFMPEETKDGHAVKIKPFPTEYKKRKNPERTVKDVVKWRNEFVELSTSLFEFREEVRKLKSSAKQSQK